MIFETIKNSHFVQNYQYEIQFQLALPFGILYYLVSLPLQHQEERGQGNGTDIRVSVYQVGGPGLHLPRSACHRKVRFYHCVIHSLCRQLVTKRPSMCYYVCVIMQVKDHKLSVITIGHCVPLAGFCLSLYSLHVLDVKYHSHKQTKTKKRVCKEQGKASATDETETSIVTGNYGP